MLEAYKMVVVNTILLAILAASIVSYKIRFPKKKIPYLLLLVLIMILPLVSILRKGTYESGALSEYVQLTYNFFVNLQAGTFFPQWAPYLCSHYGCPDFIFMYPLPYYIVSIFHIAGFSFISSIKLLLITTFISSGLAMYYFAKEFLKDKYAFTAAVLYLFAPYHLVNLHFQVDIAEMTSFVFIPLCFYTSYKLITRKSTLFFLLVVLSSSLLILSHPVISISSLPFIVIFGMITWIGLKKKKITVLLYYFLALAGGFLLTSYYWLPAMMESKFIYWGLHAITTPLPVSAMLFSPWRFGFLFQGPIGQLSYFLGFAHWIIITATGIYLFIKRKGIGKNIILLYCFLSFLVIFLGIQEIAAPIWELPILKSFQMTSRLLVLISFFTAFMGGILLSKIDRWNIWILICIIAITTTILNWGNRRPIPQIDDGYLIYELMHKPPKSMDLTAPKWTEYNKEYFDEFPNKEIEILKGKGEIKVLRHDPTLHEYIINAESNITLKENTFYYPGWELYINNKNSQINYSDKKYPGIILANLNPGTYYVILKLEPTDVQKLGKLVSLSVLALMVGIIFSLFYRKKTL